MNESNSLTKYHWLWWNKTDDINESLENNCLMINLWMMLTCFLMHLYFLSLLLLPSTPEFVLNNSQVNHFFIITIGYPFIIKVMIILQPFLKLPKLKEVSENKSNILIWRKFWRYCEARRQLLICKLAFMRAKPILWTFTKEFYYVFMSMWKKR